MAVELRLMVHGHDGCHKHSLYKNALAHCQQMQEPTLAKG